MKKAKVVISRGGYRPSSQEESQKLVAEFLLGNIGINPTVISQQMLLNIANYNYLTSIVDTGKATQANQSTLHKTVKELNAFCRSHKIPLGLLIMPHTSTSDYAGDEVVAIPWEHVRSNTLSQSAIESLFETVEADGYPQFVTDAKTVEGYNVL
ncbi:hypothetical protein pEaSNUABM40_00325 [Erwinia phage pEa_SNUABM_40]|uniref:Uncharacterized protein n=1 Tax=Erwinia phage pEa_SNUABM_3 TaxID=2869552 RepID=A0AAE7XJ74_9CAUD|nr:hypothetical protein MPK68_gp323 [Erwinia phage pEa_SNUABM_3]QZE56857.1 hypothetical protein pEaSNUABM20_00321 [Erwinia phage pEa_SNUABM_20]QZE58541.1 hypothetical protein pEaSNUABM40_00325 [Erwinia phage pEa_SNUABM_40]UAW53102.1 hypothetical protein pEaSNUABM23_00320 [Erwinia phage pEa_SNUABM_23]UIW10997.1 hypothetical protein pEaSNUABM23_00320 [Erwinia phage pEa_SNUABM_31]QZE56520.1 hypothetical protein pEaSNUABM3_00323 [Erwinia phage pEa_SNUABM_3]